jgi:hypothetical protein
MYQNLQQPPQNNSRGDHRRGGQGDKGKSTPTCRNTTNDKRNPLEHGIPSVTSQGEDVQEGSVFLGTFGNNDNETLPMMTTTTSTMMGRTADRSKQDNDAIDEASMFWIDCEQAGRKAERLTSDLLDMKRKIENARVCVYCLVWHIVGL